MDYWSGEGNIGIQMIDFIQNIIKDLCPGNGQLRYYFIMDNLSSHHNVQMLAIICNAEHRLAYPAL